VRDNGAGTGDARGLEVSPGRFLARYVSQTSILLIRSTIFWTKDVHDLLVETVLAFRPTSNAVSLSFFKNGRPQHSDLGQEYSNPRSSSCRYVSLKLTVCPARAVPRLKHNSVAAELDIVRHFGDRPLAEMNFFWTPARRIWN
jgi:hypothetical protein